MEFKQCNRCVMDNATDPNITFDIDGNCNYCSSAIVELNKNYYPNEEGERKLYNLFKKIKSENINNEYDCIMGLSGGLDSSYLALIGYRNNLRILAIHIDDGFDTEIAKNNIMLLCNKANIKLINIKPNEDQFNNLTRSYILAGVPNLAVPQDNVLFACLYKYARKYDVKYFSSDSNLALESITQEGNSYPSHDTVNIKAINKKFGTIKNDKLELMSFFEKRLYNKLYGIKTYRPLNFIDYNKDQAKKELNEFCGYEYYQAKHLENYLTMFIQTYWFYEKFQVDKGKSHLSSLIITNQITKSEVLKKLSEPMYYPEEMNELINKILTKTNLSKEVFESVMQSEPYQHTDYKTSLLYSTLRSIKRKIRGY